MSPPKSSTFPSHPPLPPMPGRLPEYLESIDGIFQTHPVFTFPLGPDTHRPRSQVIGDRLTTVTKIFRQVETSLENHHPPLYPTAKAFNSILAPITAIAISLAQTPPTSDFRSWKDIDPTNSLTLTDTINQLLTDPSLNSAFKEGLVIIRDVLIPQKNPDIVSQYLKDYETTCHHTLREGLPILFIPFDDDNIHIDGHHSAHQRQACEPNISLIFPPSPEEQRWIDQLNFVCLEHLSQFPGAKTNLSPQKNLIGYTVFSSGFGLYSQTIGEALENNSFFLSLNLCPTGNRLVWTKLLPRQDIRPYLIFTYILHEQGHKLFPHHGLLQEIATDIPALISSCQLLLDPASPLTSGLNLKQLIIFHLADQLPVITKTRDDDNQVNLGYYANAHFIVSKFLQHGLVGLYQNQVSVDTNPEKVEKLIADLRSCHQQLITDPKAFAHHLQAHFTAFPPTSKIQALLNYFQLIDIP